MSVIEIGSLLVALGGAVGKVVSATLGAPRRWSARRRLQRLVSRRQPVPLARVAPGSGQVVVQGTAHPLALQASPASGEQVIGHRVLLQILRRGDLEWTTICDETSVQDFIVYDLTGQALVRGAGAMVLARPRMRSRQQVAVDLTGGSLERLVLINGYSITDLVVASRVNCAEYLLPAGGDVLVSGQVSTVPDTRVEPTGYRSSPSRPVIEASAQAPLIVADCHYDALLASFAGRS